METRSNKDQQTSPPMNSLPPNIGSSLPYAMPGEHLVERFSYLHLFIILVGSIALAEVVARLLVRRLYNLPYQFLILIDVGILVILILPVIYFLLFRPLLLHIDRNRRMRLDITERKQELADLLRATELQNRFFDSIDIHIACLDRDFNFIRVNNTYARAGGYSPDFFIGKNHFALYPNSENEAIFRRVMETGMAFSVYTKPFEYAEQPERGVTYWDWSLQPVKNPDGTVEGLVLSLVDVTESKRAEETVRQLSRIVEQTEDTVVVTNRDGAIEYVNPAFERLTGYTKQEALGKTPRVIKSGLHDREFYQALWNTILAGEVFQSEMSNRKKNGELYYEVKTITPLRDAQGNLTHFVATGKDITEHKLDEEKLRKTYDELDLRVQERTEELRIANAELEGEIHVRRQVEDALRQSGERLRRAQEIAHLGSWELNLLTNQLTWSDEAYRIFGLQPQEFEATYEAFLETVHPADRAAVDAAYSSSIREGRDSYEIEHRIIRHSNGEIRVVHEKCEHFRAGSGQIISSVGMVHDITERKQVEEQLRYQAALLSNVNDAIVASDAQFRLTAWNSAAESLYGWKAEEVLGRQGLEIVCTEWPGIDAAEMRRAIVKTGRWRGEAVQTRRDGTRFPVEISSIVLRDNNGNVTDYISVNRDITERRQAEKQLEQSNQKLNEILASIQDDFYVLDREWNFVYASRLFTSKMGREPEDFVGKNIWEMFPKHVGTILEENFCAAMEKREVRRFEIGGKYTAAWYRMTVFPSAEGITVLGTDITERKQAEEALHASEERYRNLFENMTEEVHFWKLVRDEAGHILTWQLVDANPPSLRTWGRNSVDEIKGKPTDEIFGPGSTEHFMPVVQKIMTEAAPYSYEDYFPQLDKHFRFTSVPFGEYFITTGADITLIKKSQETLQNLNAELELRVQERTQELIREIAERKEIEKQLRIRTTAMEAAANGIVITNPRGNIQWANPALVQISGYEVRELVGQSMHIFNSGVHTEEYYFRMWDTILSGQVWRGEITNRRKDGSLYVEEQTITPVRDENDQIQHFIAVKQDITERKQAEAELAEWNIKLQALTIAEREQRQLSESLAEAALVLNRSMKLDEVLSLILEQVRAVIPYQLAIVLMFDGASVYDASHKGDARWSKALAEVPNRFPLESFPPLADMRRSHQPVLIPDTQRESSWTIVNGLEWSHSLLSVPLLAENEVIGFLNLFAEQPNFFTTEMCSLLVVFASHAAVAIQNAWLFERARASNERLQSLSRRLVEIQENERLYIARELHDEAGQMLTSLMLDLVTLESQAHEPEVILKKVPEMEEAISAISENLHNVAMALRPASLDHLGLVPALRQYVESVGERYKLKASFNAGHFQERLPASMETELYRIVQEALTNVARHAHASQVDVILIVRDCKLIVMVEDDGKGFDPANVPDTGHLGLFGMRERAEMIGGRLVIESQPGQGTTIMVEVDYDSSIVDRG